MSAQTERHEEAIRLWRMLESMSDSERAERLGDGESEVYAAPCSAMLATLVFARLGVHEEDREVYWEKLLHRPVGRVWKFYKQAEARKPEEFAGLITSFAKRVPPIEGSG